MNIEIQPYFAEGERYPALIGVRVEGDEYETAYVSKGELADALTDNAKLRELVRDMYKAFMHGNCYRWCEFKEPCNYISDGKCQWYDRMRELGVEE